MDCDQAGHAQTFVCKRVPFGRTSPPTVVGFENDFTPVTVYTGKRTFSHGDVTVVPLPAPAGEGADG